jgi:hypothetical protein
MVQINCLHKIDDNRLNSSPKILGEPVQPANALTTATFFRLDLIGNLFHGFAATSRHFVALGLNYRITTALTLVFRHIFFG